MEQESVLIGMAQIGVAMVGFTSLIGAMGGKSDPWSDLEKMRLAVLLNVSICVVLFSPVPILISAINTDGMQTWRVSNVIMLMGWITNMGYFYAGPIRKLRKTGNGPPLSSIVPLLLAGFIVVAYLGLSAIGILPPESAAPFLLSIMSLIGMGCYIFLLLLRLD